MTWLMAMIHRNPILVGVIVGLGLLCVAIAIGSLLGFAAAPEDPGAAATVGSQAAQANTINWNTIILAVISLLTTIATTIGGIYLVKIRSGQDVLTKVTNDTHTLVNSNMAAQLKLNAAVTKRLATMTNSVEDISAAELAASMYEEHVKKQAIVDRGGGVTK